MVSCKTEDTTSFVDCCLKASELKIHTFHRTNNSVEYTSVSNHISVREVEADVVILALGEKSYAEWNGDTEDMKLCGSLGLEKNGSAIAEAKALGKPTVACIVAGRQVLIDQADFDSWDSVVMCYLPGSEGKGVSDVLCGDSKFTGKLPSPWYSSADQIGTDRCWFEKGYGLEYRN